MASKRETALGALQRQIMTVITAIGMHRKKFSDVFRRLLLLEGIRESHAQAIDRIDRTMDETRTAMGELAKDCQIASLEHKTEAQDEAIDKLQLQAQAMESKLARVGNSADADANGLAQSILKLVERIDQNEKVSMELQTRINEAIKSLSAAIDNAAPKVSKAPAMAAPNTGKPFLIGMGETMHSVHGEVRKVFIPLTARRIYVEEEGGKLTPYDINA